MTKMNKDKDSQFQELYEWLDLLVIRVQRLPQWKQFVWHPTRQFKKAYSYRTFSHGLFPPLCTFIDPPNW